MDFVALAKDTEGEIEIYTPAEMAEILSQASSKLVPFLSLGAFAGIRHVEIQRLEWPDINFEKGIVDIKARKAKTANAWAALVGSLIKTFRMAGEPVTIEPAPDARRMMDTHHNQIVERRLADLRDVTTYAARWNEQAWRIAVCLHAGLHSEDAGARMLSADTAASAIALADWFAGEQLRILEGGRHAARRAKRDEVLELLADTPKGITARMVQLKRITDTADEARALLASMEADGELTGKDSKPETGGHVTWTFTKAKV